MDRMPVRIDGVEGSRAWNVVPVSLTADGKVPLRTSCCSVVKGGVVMGRCSLARYGRLILVLSSRSILIR